MAVKVEVTGGKGVAKVLAELGTRIGSGGVVKVGFLEGATYPAAAKARLASNARDNRRVKAVLGKLAAGAGVPLAVAQVAFWNEFGTSRAPARPFFRGMIAAKSPDWGRDLAKAIKARGYSVEQALALMGERIKDQLQKSIVDFANPANAPSTVARKGFDKPLIDTGTMQRSVDYVVSK